MRAYFNEIDTYAADWLANLQAGGLIEPGTIDRRSIRDVQPADLVGYDRCHFFAGVAGWSLALQLAGWPEEWPIWTGSCPCQPFSAAGKRKGTADDRHLWPEFFRLIRECRPATVIGEQVASKDGLGWLDGVFADLEGEGYACAAADLCAAGIGEKGHPIVRQVQEWARAMANGLGSDLRLAGQLRDFADYLDGFIVGAPHIRQRLFWVAHASQPRVRDRGPGADVGAKGGSKSKRDKRKRVRFDFGDARPLDPAVERIIAECGYWPGCERTHEGYHARDCPGRKWGNRAVGWLGHAPEARRPGRQDAGASGGDEGADGGGSGELERAMLSGGMVQSNGTGSRPRSGSAATDGHGHAVEPAGCGLDDANGVRESSIRRFLERSGVDAARGPWSAFRIIPCRDNKARRVSIEPGDEPLAASIPRDLGPLLAGLAGMGVDAKAAARAARRNRVGRLKGYGNAIIPVVAAEFLRAVMEILE